MENFILKSVIRYVMQVADIIYPVGILKMSLIKDG